MGNFPKALAKHRTNKTVEQPKFNPDQARTTLDCGLKEQFDLLIFK
jgi:hypothetical protein